MPQADRETAGGYFIWLTLPHGLDAKVIEKRALHEEGLIVAPGPLFRIGDKEATEKARFESDIRLCFAWAEEEELAEGVRWLARLIKRALAEKSS